MPDGNNNDDNGKSAKETADKAKAERPHDIVLVHGRTEDGAGLRALRSRPERLEAAEIRPMKEGQPIHSGAELIKLQQREESPLLYDVDVQCSAEELKGTSRSDIGRSAPARGGASPLPSARSGPPRVSTRRYRDNWETVFGGRPSKKKKKKLPN
jgi:hypothetical protein